ncbi:MAG: pentapeptide repeat-containing protein [Ottowia sp.]|uniref:pentapeptide repeat-containing protein n=1 Tax=Ottowia sp. TaxID=1898956 RepID=UPI0039E6208C
MFRLCCLMAASLASTGLALAEQKTERQRSVVTVTDDGQGSRVVIEGPLVNRAVGPGAVAETNIGGHRSVARGGAAASREAMPARGDLVNLDLAGRALGGSNWAGRRLINVDLSGADLRGANLRRAALTNVDLSDADLREADLSGAQLVNVDLSGARLRGARMADGRVCASDRCRGSE